MTFEELREDCDSGLNVNQIAKKYNLNRRTIGYWLKKFKLSVIKKENRLMVMDKNELQIIIDGCNSISKIMDKLNLPKTCTYYRNILEEKMKQCDLTKYNQNKIDKSPFSHSIPIYKEENLFCIDSQADIKVVKKRYKQSNPPIKCEECSTGTIWNNLPLVLHLDHKNGINTDNRKDNLRWICPNCHSQTSTYTGRNKKTNKIKMVGTVGFKPTI